MSFETPKTAASLVGADVSASSPEHAASNAQAAKRAEPLQMKFLIILFQKMHFGASAVKI